MAKLVLTPITDNDHAVTMNANLAAIEAFAQLALYRDGEAPNSMLADFNLNSQFIINMPAGTAPTHPLQNQQVVQLISDAALFVGADVLDDLSDVDAPAPNDLDVLTWIDANQAWEPTASSGGIADGTLEGALLNWDVGNTAWEEETNLRFNLQESGFPGSVDGNTLEIIDNVSGRAGIRLTVPGIEDMLIYVDDATFQGYINTQNLVVSAPSGTHFLHVARFGYISNNDNLSINHSTNGHAITSGTLAGDIEILAQNGSGDLSLTFGTGLMIAGKASDHASIAGAGQFWVDSADGLPYYTDDSDVIYSLIAPGESGGSTITAPYRWRTDTAEADPGAGRMRYDNATPASVTELYISTTTDSGGDLQNMLSFISADDRVYFQVDSDSADYLLMTVTATIDNGGWFTIQGTTTNSGTLPTSNDRAHILILFGGAGGGGTPGGANTQVQYNNAGAFAGDANFFWDDTNKRLTISKSGGSGSALDLTNMLANTPVVNIGGSGSSSVSQIPMRMTDNSGTQFFQLFFDTSLSAGNHKLEIQSSATGTTPFIEFDGSGEMSLFGQQNSEAILFTALTGTKKMKAQIPLYMEERASADGDVASEGQFWVRNDAPNTPMFTDDTGVDHVLNAGGVSFPLDAADDELIRYGDSQDITMGWNSAGYFDVLAAVADTELRLPLQSGLVFRNNGTGRVMIKNVGILGFNDLQFTLENGSANALWDIGPMDFNEHRLGQPRLDCFTVQSGTENSVANAVTYDHAFGVGADVWITTLTENITSVTFANIPAAGHTAYFEIEIIQDTVARTITWPGSVVWDGGTAPDLTTTSGRYLVSLRTRDGGTQWMGVWSGPYS